MYLFRKARARREMKVCFIGTPRGATGGRESERGGNRTHAPRRRQFIGNSIPDLGPPRGVLKIVQNIDCKKSAKMTSGGFQRVPKITKNRKKVRPGSGVGKNPSSKGVHFAILVFSLQREHRSAYLAGSPKLFKMAPKKFFPGTPFRVPFQQPFIYKSILDGF